MQNAENGDRVLLDTHCWIWMVSGQFNKFSQDGVRTLRNALDSKRVLVSRISAWETALLVSKQRVRLSTDVLQWVKDAAAHPAITTTDLTFDILVGSTRLPGEPHGDPADRILIATARELDATLLTADRQLLDYAKDGHIRAVAA